MKMNLSHSTSELYRFALEGNADQVFAIIDDSFQDDEEYTAIADKYENAKIDDTEFCYQIVQEIEKAYSY
jgi:hypothetical protein